MKSNRLTRLMLLALFTTGTIPELLVAQEQPAKQQQNGEHHRYRFVDIGTFGGPASFLNPPFNAVPALNSRGITVGSSATSVPTTATNNGFVCGGIDGIVPFVFHAFKWQDGVVSDLGALPPSDQNCSNAVSINARGEIVGASETREIDPLLGIKGLRALLWTHDKMVDLGTLGGKFTVPTGINNRAQVVGGATNTIPDPFGFGTQTRAFLWQDGIMQDLGTLGGPDSFAEFVNERGQVAGFSFTNSTPNPVTGLPTGHPFIWENGRMTDLGSLGGTLAGNGGFNMLGGFNNRGELVGLSTLPGDQIVDPFLWNGKKLIDLFTETIGGSPVSANAVNDAGEIVGAAAFSTNRPFDAYLWREGVAIDLGTLDGDCYSEGWAISSKGQVVGISFACDFSRQRAFLWENGSIVDLDTLIPAHSSLQLQWPLAVNDRGEIAGIGGTPGVSPPDYTTMGHAFVLIPCEHSNEQGCEGGGEAAVPNNPSPAMDNRLTPREIAARMRARFGWNRRFGTWPGK
jgi:probable HAF family extracellular repeat protein